MNKLLSKFALLSDYLYSFIMSLSQLVIFYVLLYLKGLY